MLRIMMFTQSSKMKYNTKKDFLQKELEFYTNLLSQHEKNKEKKNFDMPCTSSNIYTKRPYNTHPSMRNEMFTFIKANNINIKTLKRDHNINNKTIYNNLKRKNTFSIQKSQTLQISNSNSFSSSKMTFIKNNVKSPNFSSKVIGHTKPPISNCCKYNSTTNYSEKLTVSDSKASNKFPMSVKVSSESNILLKKESSTKTNSIAIMNKDESVNNCNDNSVKNLKKRLTGSDSKVSNKLLMDKEIPVESKILLKKEASAKFDSGVINKNESKNSLSKALLCENISVISTSNISKNKQTTVKSDSKALMGEIEAVTKQLKMKSETRDSSAKLLKPQSRFKKVNTAVKIEEKVESLPKTKSLQSIKENANINTNSVATLIKKNTNASARSKNKATIPAKVEANLKSITPKLQFITSQEYTQKDNSKMHMTLLEKLNAVEKLLNATTQNSAKTLNQVEKHSSKSKMKLNNNVVQKIASSKYLNMPTTQSKQQLVASIGLDLKNSDISNQSFGKRSFKLNKKFSTNSSFIQKSFKGHQTSKLKLTNKFKEVKNLFAKEVKTQYKIINNTKLKILSTNSKSVPLGSMNKYSNQHPQKNFNRLMNNRNLKLAKNCSKRTYVKGANFKNYLPTRIIFSPLKKTPNKVLKNSSTMYTSNIKSKQTLNNGSCEFYKNLQDNSKQSPFESSGIDVDLLLELAAENKNKLSKSVARRRWYKSKKILINSYSVQARTAKMIKTKYFNPYRKPADSKTLLSANRSLKGYKINYAATISKNSKRFSNKLEIRKCHQKRIVNLGGERFIVGSTGRTLKKLNNQSAKTRKMSLYKKTYKGKPVIKTPKPVSKIIASRALNRSINQVLSASTKKKMQKINKYCMFYNRFGRCNKGIKCPFVHDPSKIAVCTRFLRGTCKSNSCLFSHEINPGKMAICSFFLQDACTKDDCPYLHEKLSLDAEVCKPFVQGYCPHGKDCKKAHILVCSKFLRGQCDKGKNCPFPHPRKQEKLLNSHKSSDDNEKRNEFQLETVLRYFESNPQESLTRGLVVPRIKTLPEQPAFISLTMDETS